MSPPKPSIFSLPYLLLLLPLQIQAQVQTTDATLEACNSKSKYVCAGGAECCALPAVCIQDGNGKNVCVRAGGFPNRFGPESNPVSLSDLTALLSTSALSSGGSISGEMTTSGIESMMITMSSSMMAPAPTQTSRTIPTGGGNINPNPNPNPNQNGVGNESPSLPSSTISPATASAERFVHKESPSSFSCSPSSALPPDCIQCLVPSQLT